MPVSQSQRLRKAAAKAAKRKVVAAEKLAQDRRELNISKPQHVDLARSPIVGCWVTDNFQSKGMASVSVVRKLSLGRYALGVFLLDLECLGVKDAFFRVASAAQFETYQYTLSISGDKAIAPGRARKLVSDSAAYGAANGFPPPAEFAELERMLGDVAPSDDTFVFGKDGKPHYIRGPRETEQRAMEIVAKLRDKFGEGGFNFTIALGDLDGFDDEDDGDLIEGEAEEFAEIAPSQDRDQQAA